jgi:hypothetical protein
MIFLVFITLEQTGKWGKNLKVIQSYKTACYIELASEFSNTHRVNAVAKDDCVLILLVGIDLNALSDFLEWRGFQGYDYSRQ